MRDKLTFGAIILAAGRSKRFGKNDKLLEVINNMPMIRQTVDNASRANLTDIVVVVGENSDSIDAALQGTNPTIIRNAEPWLGMGTSLATGADAMDENLDGIFVVLGDMPLLQSTTYDELMNAFDPASGRDIVVPVHNDRRGHPVLFSSAYLPLLRALDGDKGAREILESNPERVQNVDVADPGVLMDIDTPDDLPNS